MCEDKIGSLDQNVFGLSDAVAVRRSGREVIAAVIDHQLRVQYLDQLQGQGGRQPSPNDRVVEPHGPRPATERPEHQRLVDSAGYFRVGEGQDQRGIHIEVVYNLPDPLDPTPPVQHALPESYKILEWTLRTPVFSMKRTRYPCLARVDMISWYPCQIKPQSIVEIQTMLWLSWITPTG